MDPAALPWAEFGVLGLIVLAFITGWVVPGKTHQREVERGDRLVDENTRLRDATEERVLPLVERCIAALDNSRTRTLEAQASEMKEQLRALLVDDGEGEARDS